MNWRRIYGKLLAGRFILQGKVHASFSQAGEDQAIRYLINDCLQLEKPTYLEIGTHHPVFGNNTYYFYTRESKGVCVEPDPRYESLIKKYRKRDILITGGVGDTQQNNTPFYVFPKGYGGWNSFSREEADKRKAETGIAYDVILKDVVTINELMEAHFQPWPNILSLDVEGLDLAILKSVDFDRFQPEIICVESITFSNSNEQEKISEIGNFMSVNGYFSFADTYVNTIFCKTSAFKKIIR